MDNMIGQHYCYWSPHGKPNIKPGGSGVNTTQFHEFPVKGKTLEDRVAFESGAVPGNAADYPVNQIKYSKNVENIGGPENYYG